MYKLNCVVICLFTFRVFYFRVNIFRHKSFPVFLKKSSSLKKIVNFFLTTGKLKLFLGFEIAFHKIIEKNWKNFCVEISYSFFLVAILEKNTCENHSPVF